MGWDGTVKGQPSILKKETTNEAVLVVVCMVHGPRAEPGRSQGPLTRYLFSFLTCLALCASLCPTTCHSLIVSAWPTAGGCGLFWTRRTARQPPVPRGLTRTRPEQLVSPSVSGGQLLILMDCDCSEHLRAHKRRWLRSGLTLLPSHRQRIPKPKSLANLQELSLSHSSAISPGLRNEALLGLSCQKQDPGLLMPQFSHL